MYVYVLSGLSLTSESVVLVVQQEVEHVITHFFLLVFIISYLDMAKLHHLWAFLQLVFFCVNVFCNIDVNSTLKFHKSLITF